MEKLSGSRWQHQEDQTSSSDDERTQQPFRPRNGYSPGAPDISNGTQSTNLTNGQAKSGPQPPTVAYEQCTHTNSSGHGRLVDGRSTTGRDVMCGPLLNYTGMHNLGSTNPSWHGSVLLVTRPGQHQPELRLHFLQKFQTMEYDGVASAPPRPLNCDADATYNRGPDPSNSEQRRILGIKLYADSRKVFWRFTIEVPVLQNEACWEYSLSLGRDVPTTGQPAKEMSSTFVVPAVTQSMRMMFHSCNGFSVGTDEEAWSGPALWNDVMRMHNEKPFHVMIGGGDQIYNDGVRVGETLQAWTDISNPKRRRDYPFGEKLRKDCDDYYFNNYSEWYSTEAFASANRQIPQINIWDDHGIALRISLHHNRPNVTRQTSSTASAPTPTTS
ncbi:MAG: hypothetical protein LQ347_005108 [Umbilicaria vellea]|nr:MAG: hypothetical protein LQ347_005108 [Umbilicaria vellea]